MVIDKRLRPTVHKEGACVFGKALVSFSKEVVTVREVPVSRLNLLSESIVPKLEELTIPIRVRECDISCLTCDVGRDLWSGG